MKYEKSWQTLEIRCEAFRYCDIPGIAEAGLHQVVQCGRTLAHVGLSQTAVVGNIWLGSDQDGTPSGKTVCKHEITG